MLQYRELLTLSTLKRRSSKNSHPHRPTPYTPRKESWNELQKDTNADLELELEETM